MHLPTFTNTLEFIEAGRKRPALPGRWRRAPLFTGRRSLAGRKGPALRVSTRV